MNSVLGFSTGHSSLAFGCARFTIPGMKYKHACWVFVGFWAFASSQRPVCAEVVVAEGEWFKPLDDKGWKLTHQNDSYASHTYGGMWVTQGAGLGAAADSVGSTAVLAVQVPKAGKYRVWSK